MKATSILAAAAVAASFGVISAGAIADEKPITLRFADTQSLMHPVSVEGAQFFIKRVSELSGGRIKIQHFPAEQLGKSKDTLDVLARGGITDISFVGPSWYPGKLPLATVGDLPGMYADAGAASKAVWNVISTTIYERELRKRGIRPLVAVLTPTYQILSTRTLDDLEKLGGLKVRSPGGTFDNAAIALGATPVSMPANESYEAMQKGVLAATFANYVVADGQKLNEVVKFGTFGAPLGSFTNLYCINQRVWETLPKFAQEVLTKAGTETMDRLNEALAFREKELVSKWEATGVMTVKHLTDAEQKRLFSVLQPVQEKWAADMERRGLPGNEILAQFKRQLQAQSTK